jgi:hypothetical protein
MAQLRAMLEDRRGDKPVEDWAMEINQSIANPEDRVRISTLYAYLNGKRNITGKGARSLAQYFYKKNDLDMVNAITEVTLGIPYPSSSQIN